MEKQLKFSASIVSVIIINLVTGFSKTFI